MRQIRELDFDAIIGRIASATDKRRRAACDDLFQAKLTRIESPVDAWRMLRNHLLIAIVRHAQTFDDVRFELPLVQAIVRAQHHPLAEPIPEYELQGGLAGPDVAPHLNALAESHTELAWDLDAVQQLIIRGILEFGEHKLDDAIPPWLMHWADASAAATALITLVTLRALGDLT